MVAVVEVLVTVLTVVEKIQAVDVFVVIVGEELPTVKVTLVKGVDVTDVAFEFVRGVKVIA